jgi:DUF1680 family protein
LRYSFPGGNFEDIRSEKMAGRRQAIITPKIERSVYQAAAKDDSLGHVALTAAASYARAIDNRLQIDKMVKRIAALEKAVWPDGRRDS